MDEATSALDTITEYRILTVIHELLPNTAVIMVAHRLNTVINCDQILVLDENGHVAERGTHHDLLKLKRRYANLWNQQDYKVTNIA
jgi:ATP-binding cassette subfamily B protein